MPRGIEHGGNRCVPNVEMDTQNDAYSTDNNDLLSKSSYHSQTEDVIVDGIVCSDELIVELDTENQAYFDDSNDVQTKGYEESESGDITTDDIKSSDKLNFELNTDNNDMETKGSDEIAKEDIPIDTIEYDKTCRICMKQVTDNAKNIFEDHLYEEVPIYLGMAVCIYPIEVSIEDSLSQYSCNDCLEKLTSFLKFRNFVIRNDQVQRERIGCLKNKKNASQKRNIDADNEFHLKKKKMKTNILEQNEPTLEFAVLLNNNQSPSLIQENSIPEARTLDMEQRREDKLILIVEEGNEHIDTNSSPNSDGNVSFCMVNGYLMEHKFSKEYVRFLKCASSKCPAIGKQEVLVPGLYKKTVILIKPHNHDKPTDIDIKKQKIISVVRKKLQVRKGSTIESVYDEVSKLDPAVAELLPIKVLMAEICNL